VSLVGLVDDVAARLLSAREAVQQVLDRIDRVDPAVNAFVTVRAEQALAEADVAPPGPLHGVPVGIKDVIDVAGSPTTAGSSMLTDNRAVCDATAVARLRAAGAVVVGKLNTHEFAYGPTTTSSHIGPTRNPWSLDRITGGSSGGSAAAVAAELAIGALGTDTAGSVRMPAALCGVTALRPTPGLVPLDGVIPVAPTFDTVGPMAGSAADCTVLFRVLAGLPASREDPDPASQLRVGVLEALVELAEPGVAACVGAAVSVLAELGARVEPVAIPLLPAAGAIQQAIMLTEAASGHLARLRTSLDRYSVDVRRRLLCGLFLPGSTYSAGLRLRELFRANLAVVFQRYDVLVAPTMPCVAPPIRRDRNGAPDAYAAYRRAVVPFNAPWTVAGQPVLNVPCGFSTDLPVGLSLVGRPNEDETVLALGRAFQSATNWHLRAPAIAADVPPPRREPAATSPD
jgi:aspartyl-tRNA(Asn)/glutamyl-tRNA(Gln) amidotransferase subunit A